VCSCRDSRTTKEAVMSSSSSASSCRDTRTANKPHCVEAVACVRVAIAKKAVGRNRLHFFTEILKLVSHCTVKVNDCWLCYEAGYISSMIIGTMC
jgi:hypothetical protein